MTDVINPNTETVTDTTKTVVPSDQPVETSAQQPAQTTEEVFDKDRAMSTIRNLREQEKAWKKERSELEQLRAEKAKQAEAEMTEAQRLQKQADELKAQNARLQADLLRREVIAETGIPSMLADRLQGTTKEELLADAQKLAELLPKTPKAPSINATNPGNTVGETIDQRRARLSGSGINIFDENTVRQTGGGVFWPEQNQ